MRNIPLFVGGVDGASATRLTRLLSRHPDVAGAWDTDFVTEVAPIALGPGRPSDRQKLRLWRAVDQWTRTFAKHGQNVNVDRYGVLARLNGLLLDLDCGLGSVSLRELILWILETHAANEHKRCWVNKSDSYVHHLDELHRLFPRMRFVHVVRDVRHIAVDLVRRPNGPQTLHDASFQWEQQVRPGLAWGAANPGQYKVVRYEGLVEDPVGTVQDVFDWVGWDADASEFLANVRADTPPPAPARVAETVVTYVGPLLRELGYAA